MQLLYVQSLRLRNSKFCHKILNFHNNLFFPLKNNLWKHYSLVRHLVWGHQKRQPWISNGSVWWWMIRQPTGRAVRGTIQKCTPNLSLNLSVRYVRSGTFLAETLLLSFQIPHTPEASCKVWWVVHLLCKWNVIQKASEAAWPAWPFLTTIVTELLVLPKDYAKNEITSPIRGLG